MQMFIWNNIFFSMGFDVKDHYKDFGGDYAAHVAPVSIFLIYEQTNPISLTDHQCLLCWPSKWLLVIILLGLSFVYFNKRQSGS